jgi:transcription antitermination factor NusG
MSCSIPNVAATFERPDPRAIAETRQWYAVHTRSRHEKNVAAQLREKNVWTYLPLSTQKHRWSDRKKLVEVPLFPGYAFVQINRSDEDRLSVLCTRGVVSIVGSQGFGTPIPSKQIEDVARLLDQRVPFALFPFLREGQRVRIRGGSLDGVEGVLVKKGLDQHLVVSVELLQRSVAVRIIGYDLEPIGSLA